MPPSGDNLSLGDNPSYYSSCMYAVILLDKTRAAFCSDTWLSGLPFFLLSPSHLEPQCDGYESIETLK